MVKRIWFPSAPDGESTYLDRMSQAIGMSVIGGLFEGLISKVVHRDRGASRSVRFDRGNKVIHHTHITKVVK